MMPPKPGEGAGLGESCSGCLSGGGSSGYLLLPNELSHTVRLQIATLACLARGPAVWTELSEDSLFSSWHIGRGESARVRVLGDLVSGWLTHVTGRSALAPLGGQPGLWTRALAFSPTWAFLHSGWVPAAGSPRELGGRAGRFMRQCHEEVQRRPVQVRGEGTWTTPPDGRSVWVTVRREGGTGGTAAATGPLICFRSASESEDQAGPCFAEGTRGLQSVRAERAVARGKRCACGAGAVIFLFPAPVVQLAVKNQTTPPLRLTFRSTCLTFTVPLCFQSQSSGKIVCFLSLPLPNTLIWLHLQYATKVVTGRVPSICYYVPWTLFRPSGSTGGLVAPSVQGVRGVAVELTRTAGRGRPAALQPLASWDWGHPRGACVFPATGDWPLPG